jgi:hypothetical protein
MAAKRSKIPKVPLVLGLAGLLPFLGGSALALFATGALKETAILSLMTYGAVILSFLGGATWGARLGNKNRVSDWSGMTWSVIPSLIAWPSLLLAPVVCLAVLTAGFLLQYFLDTDSVKSKIFPNWYGRLRLILTGGAVFSLLTGATAVLIGK